MSKKSGKSNAFPVEEAINAAAHFDVSGVRSGIVELLSGNEAMAKFYSMRADGQYFKPHQIYFAVYRTKTEFQAPVADKHHMQSKGTITDCAKAHKDVFDAEPDYNTYIKHLDIGECPAGTPFFMKYLTGDDVERFGIAGTMALDDDNYYNNTKRRYRTYIATRIIPKMGKAILRDTASRFGIKTKGNTTEAITCEEVKADGSVCGGVFRKDTRGDYVCQVCGLIYERDDKFVAEDINSTTYDYESDSDEEVLEAAPTQKDLEVGGILPMSIMTIESRLSKNIAAFRKSIATAPKDEVSAKVHAHEVKVADTQARKVASSAKRKESNVRAHDVYEGKWNMLSTNAMIARVLHFIRVDKVTTVSGLTNAMGVHRMYVVRAIEKLVASGRLLREENDKTGKGKVITVTYVPSGNEYKGRCPKEQVMPVLNQVKYGGIQGTTINYRNSKLIVAIYDATAQTLYSRKE